MTFKTIFLAGALITATAGTALAAQPTTGPGADNAATPATPATPAIPADPSTGTAATPATPATPAEPSAQASDPLAPDAQATATETKAEKPVKKSSKKKPR